MPTDLDRAEWLDRLLQGGWPAFPSLEEIEAIQRAIVVLQDYYYGGLPGSDR